MAPSRQNLLSNQRRRCGSDDNEVATPFGSLLVVRNYALVDRAVGIGQTDVGRHMADTIRDFKVADADRTDPDDKCDMHI